ncbi:hypothetical protein vBSsoS008_039 [Shigella phage vB_SsoS_008]|nr:hypothetical protein vBSsoS008_039 [Shigella phage vB_SsoS_008]
MVRSPGSGVDEARSQAKEIADFDKDGNGETLVILPRVQSCIKLLNTRAGG